MLSRTLQRSRPSRAMVILAVALGHGLVFYVLGLLAQQPLFGRSPLGVVPSQEATRLLVNLLPFVAQPVTATPATARQTRAPESPQFERPVGQIAAAMAPGTVAVSATPFSPSNASNAPVPVAFDSAIQLDGAALQRVLREADQGTVRDLAKRAGRTHDIEPERSDTLARSISGAAKTNLRELRDARIAREDACRQELGLSGMGDRSHSNDRDTFAPSYIGTGRVCKTSR